MAPREALEAVVFHIEEVLEEHVSDIAPGASASADFQNDTVEIDVTLTGSSPGELHQRLAIIISALEQHCALNVSFGSNRGQLALTSSATQVERPLIPA